MSVTVSNCLQICGSPLNTSEAKNLWSFAKSSRFDKLENPNNCQQAFYDLPPVADKRKAGIGYGTKFDLTKQTQKTPAPVEYNIKGDVEFNKTKNKGFQFGVGRDKMWQTGILGGVNKKNPGPGQYDLGSTLSKTKYSMRPKTQGNLMILNKFVPGPGTYLDIPSINALGKYQQSKFYNSCATLFNPPKSKRFTDSKQDKEVPGPGNYKIDFTGLQKANQIKDGKYILSNQHSSQCRSFPHDQRRTESLGGFAKTPGPGSYRIPSDFGYYESKHKEQFISKSQERLPEPEKKEN